MEQEWMRVMENGVVSHMASSEHTRPRDYSRSLNDDSFSDKYLSKKGIPEPNNEIKQTVKSISSTLLVKELMVRAATAIIMSMQSEWSDFGKKK